MTDHMLPLGATPREEPRRVRGPSNFEVMEVTGVEADISHGIFDTLDEARGCVEYDKLTRFEIWQGDHIVDEGAPAISSAVLQALTVHSRRFTWTETTFVASRCCGRLCYASKEALDSERANDPDAAIYTDAELAESWDFCLNHLEGIEDPSEYVACRGIDGEDEPHGVDAPIAIRMYEYRSADQEAEKVTTWNRRPWCDGCAANARFAGAVINGEGDYAEKPEDTYVPASESVWSGGQCDVDPDNCWIDDKTGEHVDAHTGTRTPPDRVTLTITERTLFAIAAALDVACDDEDEPYPGLNDAKTEVDAIVARIRAAHADKPNDDDEMPVEDAVDDKPGWLGRKTDTPSASDTEQLDKLIQWVADISFECGEWDENYSDKTYEELHNELQEAKAKLRGYVLTGAVPQ